MTDSRRKGYMGEKRWRELCKEQGFEVIWHNNDPDKPDTTVEDLTVEVKFKATVPKTLYKWLDQDGADAVASRRVSKKEQHREWLVTMRKDLFFKLLKQAKQNEVQN